MPICRERRYRDVIQGPTCGGFGAAPSKFCFLPRQTCHMFRLFCSTWFFADGFLFPVKELGLLTNPGHWVRVLDVAGSYMYIVLQTMYNE
jgi:hypothetical protein